MANTGIPAQSTDAIAAPNTLGTMGVERDLKLRALNKKLEMESVLDDIFEDLGGDVVSSGQEVAVPNAIFLRLEAVPTGARHVTLPMLMALDGDPTVGPGTPLGNEDSQNLKYTTFYYDEYSYAVASTEWGTNANDMGVYGVFEKIQPQISLYMKEYRGQRIREAILLTHDSVLTGAGTKDVSGNALVPKWNKNWFIANTDINVQPVYDATTATFTASIAAALKTAGGLTDGVDANIDLNYLLSLEYYAKNYLRIEPIMVGGKSTYVCLIPSSQVSILKRDNPGQLGDIYTSMVRKNEDVMEYTGAIGRVGDLLLIEDQRYATGNTDGTATVTPAFLKPGNNDGRNKGAYDGSGTYSGDFDFGSLLGKAAVCEWTVKGLHFETESQNYGYNKGTGAFGESGISIVEYDVETGWDGTTDERENTGSIVLAWSAPTITV